MRYFIIITALLVLAAGASSCGKKGPPLPPLETAALVNR